MARDTDGGYGKPPRKHRFKKGKSGNPRGRPKGSRNISTVIEKELNGRVTVTENGQQRRFSKSQVAAKQLVNKAMTGDQKAIQAILNLYKNQDAPTGDVAPLGVFDKLDHHLVMADICRRIRSMTEPPDGPGPCRPLPARLPA